MKGNKCTFECNFEKLPETNTVIKIYLNTPIFS